MREEDQRLDTALELCRSARELAEWARDLARPEAAELELAIAEQVVALAARITSTATCAIDRRLTEGIDPE